MDDGGPEALSAVMLVTSLLSMLGSFSIIFAYVQRGKRFRDALFALSLSDLGLYTFLLF